MSAEAPRNDDKSKSRWKDLLLETFWIDKDTPGRWRDSIKEMKFKDWTDFFTAAGTVAVGLTLFVLTGQYFDQELTNRLKRTSDVLAAAENSVREEEYKDIIREFPGRWQREIKLCLAQKEAEAFLEVAIKPDEDPDKYRRWNLARKYLNRVEIIAFPYFYDLADRNILATSACGYVTRSNKYFADLINVFGEYFGGGQSWQVIRRAAKIMEDRWGASCKNLESEKERALTPKYTLPPPLTTPASGESQCPTP